MTLPDERFKAVLMAKNLLEDIAYNSKENVRVPKTFRARAHTVLRHFPDEWDLRVASKLAPDIFQERIEPVYRLILEHEVNQTKTNES